MPCLQKGNKVQITDDKMTKIGCFALYHKAKYSRFRHDVKTAQVALPRRVENAARMLFSSEIEKVTSGRVSDSTRPRFLNSLLGSFSNDDGNGNENVLQKHKLTLFRSRRNCSSFLI